MNKELKREVGKRINTCLGLAEESWTTFLDEREKGCYDLAMSGRDHALKLEARARSYATLATSLGLFTNREGQRVVKLTLGCYDRAFGAFEGGKA